MAQEGAFDFGAENWGPQPVRVLLANNGGAINLAVGVAADEGIEEFADLKGKRVAYIVGAPALNVNTEAYLAYGGLTWDDVERVDFGGFGASWKGLIEGQVDAAFASTNSGMAYEAAGRPARPVLAADRPREQGGHRADAGDRAVLLAEQGHASAPHIDGTDGYQGAGYPIRF